MKTVQSSKFEKSDLRDSRLKILIVSLDNLGDTVMATSLAKPLKEAFPHSTVSVWTKSYGCFIPSQCPWVDHTFHADPFWVRSPGKTKGSWSLYAKTLWRIRQEKFDEAIILHTDWRKALSCRLAGIPKRIGFRQKKSDPWLTHKITPPQPEEHLMEAAQRLLSKTLDHPPVLSCYLSPPSNTTKKPWIALHPFSGDLSRCWSLDRWHSLARQLLDQSSSQILLIASEKEKKAHAQPLNLFQKDLGNRLTFSTQLISDLASCELFLGHDSGPLHIACALGIPSIGLFLTEKKNYWPRGRGPSVIFSKNSIDQIQLSEVLVAIESLKAVPS